MRFDAMWLTIRIQFYKRFCKKDDRPTDALIQEVVEILEDLPAGKVVHECHGMITNIQRGRADASRKEGKMADKTVCVGCHDSDCRGECMRPLKFHTASPAQSDAPSAEPMTEFRKALNCLYIAVDAHVADDVVRRANAALEHLTKQRDAAEAALSEARERAQKVKKLLDDSIQGVRIAEPEFYKIEIKHWDKVEQARALLAGASGAAGNGGAE